MINKILATQKKGKTKPTKDKKLICAGLMYPPIDAKTKIKAKNKLIRNTRERVILFKTDFLLVITGVK